MGCPKNNAFFFKLTKKKNVYVQFQYNIRFIKHLSK
jgi:hypothetical protein